MEERRMSTYVVFFPLEGGVIALNGNKAFSFNAARNARP